MRACMQVAIDFGFASHWLKKRRESFTGQSQSEATQNQSKRNFVFDAEMKTALCCHQKQCMLRL